jgi:hypothetical protein
MAARRVIELALRRGVPVAQVAFIALSPVGDVGAACTAGTDFYYAVGRDDVVDVRKAPEIV